MNIYPYGQSALIVNFGQQVDVSINDKVHRLHIYLIEKNIPGVVDMIPSYCDLTIQIDPDQLEMAQLISVIESYSREENRPFAYEKELKLPVCYEKSFAPDINVVCEFTGLTKEEVIKMHSAQSYKVYMYGFIPGFAYMGKLNSALTCPRKSSPRIRVEKGSVAIADRQTAIYPVECPGGWQIIGRCPIPVFEKITTAAFIFKPGDLVKFEPIQKEIFNLLLEYKISWDINEGRIKS